MSAALKHLDGQRTYQKNPTIDHPPPGNDQDNLVASGPSHMEYYPQSAHVRSLSRFYSHDILMVCLSIHAPQEILDGGVGDYLPPVPDLANSFPQSVPDTFPPGTSAMESLKRFADRYLHDPGSRIDTPRMGLNPSGGRLRVTITFDIDV